MLLERLKAFQVDPNRVDRVEIVKLVNKINNGSKASEVQGLFDLNISLTAYFFKTGYIDYQKIYFLSTGIVDDEANRPDYLCGCYHKRYGMAWYAIVVAGPQDRIWDDQLQLTSVGKRSFDRLNYCTNNLEKIILSNGYAEKVKPKNIRGLLIIGQEREFVKNEAKQARKREINQNSAIKVRTYGAFLRSYQRGNRGWLLGTIDRAISLFVKPDA
jgi:hypothetical protein